jgi:DME family drug/metabolite transporter
LLEIYLPALLSLLSAFLFAVGAQFQNMALGDLDSRAAAAISITSAALLYWALAPFMLEPAHFLVPATLIFVAIGVFRPSVSANLSITGMKYLGPTLSTTLSSTAPLFGMALGVLWLGEVLTWEAGTGTMVIVAAVALLAHRKRGGIVTFPIWALLFPVAAALIRSLGHVLAKIGMEDIPDPYFVGLIAFSVSSVVAVAAHLLRKNGPVIRWRNGTPLWHVGAGMTFGFATVSLNTALLHGEVIVVVPIVAASPIFSLLLSVFLFRREKITPKIVIAVLMVVPAVALIAISR